MGHGGGHINHSIFWQNLSPNGGGGPGLATTKPASPWPLLPVPTRIHWSQQLVWYHCWELIFGNMPITFSTRMSELTTSKTFLRSSIGKMWRRGLALLSSERCKRSYFMSV